MNHSLGFCGKIPSRGDFVQNGLPAKYLDKWNEWHQAALAVSREQLGVDWLNYYLTSPVWNFALSAGVCSDAPMAGTFIPSVDNVGRHYPFTIATEVVQVPVQMWSDRNWVQQTNQAALNILEEEFNYQDWLNLIKREPALWPDVNSLEASNAALPRSTGWAFKNTNFLTPLSLLHHSYKNAFERYCLWWTEGSEHLSTTLLITQGLPQVSSFAAMLDGNWKEWGWDQQQLINLD